MSVCDDPPTDRRYWATKGRGAFRADSAKKPIRLQVTRNGDFSRENVMKVFTHLHNFHPAGGLPGIALNTTPDNYQEFSSMRNMEFDGARWVLLPADETM